MKQSHLVGAYVATCLRRESKRREKHCDSFPADQFDADLILALGSDSGSKSRLCAEVINEHSSRNLVVVLAEATLTVAEVLGKECALEFTLDIRQTLERQTLERECSTTAIAGFTLGILRASVELPGFLVFPGTRSEVEKLLFFACYPWAGSHISSPHDLALDRYMAEPSMDVSGSASALNNAARAFIATEIRHGGEKGQRVAIASNILSKIRSPENREMPLGWVGQKVMEPLTDGILHQIRFPERADLLLRFLTELTTPKK